MQEMKAILANLQVQAGLHGQDLVAVQKTLQRIAQFLEQHDARLKALETRPAAPAEPDPQP